MLRKLLAIYSTGSLISVRNNKSIFFVDQESDIPKWISEMPEAQLLASINSKFIQGEHDTFTLDTMQRIVDTLVQQRENYDGFIVLTRAEYMAVTASYCEFALQGFGKPIVFTGSRYSPESIALKDIRKVIDAGGLGLRSNFINALQVATNKDFHAIAIMFGNKLVKPTKAIIADYYSINLFRSIDDEYLGKVDFGITLKRLTKMPLSRPAPVPISHNVVIMGSNAIGSYGVAESLNSGKTPKTLLLHLQPNEQLPPETIEALQKTFSRIVCYNQFFIIDQLGCISLSRMTWPAAVAKVLWADAQTKDTKKFTELLQQNIINEILDL